MLLRNKKEFEYAIKSIRADKTEILQQDLIELHENKNVNSQLITLIKDELIFRGVSFLTENVRNTIEEIKEKDKREVF
ncbi:MAG: hypothetical protein ACRC92_21520 [Peptostreptococcaceae bacterium]